jgi:hypothetical protein
MARGRTKHSDSSRRGKPRASKTSRDNAEFRPKGIIWYPREQQLPHIKYREKHIPGDMVKISDFLPSWKGQEREDVDSFDKYDLKFEDSIINEREKYELDLEASRELSLFDCALRNDTVCARQLIEQGVCINCADSESWNSALHIGEFHVLKSLVHQLMYHLQRVNMEIWP